MPAQPSAARPAPRGSQYGQSALLSFAAIKPLRTRFVREPRQRRSLTQRVRDPFGRAQLDTFEPGKRPFAADIAPPAGHERRREQSEGDTDRREAVVHRHRAAVGDLRPPSNEVVAGRSGSRGRRRCRGSRRRRRRHGRPGNGSGCGSPARPGRPPTGLPRTARCPRCPPPTVPVHCCGPRSLPPWGSIATTPTPSAAAAAITMSERAR